VLYYSNAILARSFPTLGKYVSLAITLVNAGMTVPAIFLVDVRPPRARAPPRRAVLIARAAHRAQEAVVRLGRRRGHRARPLRHRPRHGLADAVDRGDPRVRHVRTPLVARSAQRADAPARRSFAVGMGPVPFVLIPELSPPHAVAALASLGLSVHCTRPTCCAWPDTLTSRARRGHELRRRADVPPAPELARGRRARARGPRVLRVCGRARAHARRVLTHVPLAACGARCGFGGARDSIMQVLSVRGGYRVEFI
jgi:hypothetical protein